MPVSPALNAWILRWCQGLLKHWGAGLIPPGRGQEETDKCATPGVNRVSRLGIRPYVLAGRRGAAQLLGPAMLPGNPALHQAPGTPVLYPDPVSRSYIPTTPTRNRVAWHPGFTTLPSQGPLQFLRRAQLLSGASGPAARAEPGSSPSSLPWGVCDSPHYSRPGDRADSSTDKPCSKWLEGGELKLKCKFCGRRRRPDLKKRFQICGACKSTGGVSPKAGIQKWDAGHLILKKKAEAREKRNTVDGLLQVVLQIVEHIAERKVEGNQGQSQDLGPEIFSLAHILMIEDAGIDRAVALLMALEENEVEVVQGVEGNPIEFRGLGQKAEQE
ncbi:PREDICTED: uncharacterized protein LOC103073694, partial [Lipotes vexillifer]|uniref:Uncharacterized protein LOC103073694 n=1 Tax=Lipotes vexillifer TaxID=118797 RepID=A0A340XQP5_LIPVE